MIITTRFGILIWKDFTVKVGTLGVGLRYVTLTAVISAIFMIVSSVWLCTMAPLLLQILVNLLLNFYSLFKIAISTEIFSHLMIFGCHLSNFFFRKSPFFINFQLLFFWIMKIITLVLIILISKNGWSDCVIIFEFCNVRLKIFHIVFDQYICRVIIVILHINIGRVLLILHPFKFAFK